MTCPPMSMVLKSILRNSLGHPKKGGLESRRRTSQETERMDGNGEGIREGNGVNVNFQMHYACKNDMMKPIKYN